MSQTNPIAKPSDRISVALFAAVMLVVLISRALGSDPWRELLHPGPTFQGTVAYDANRGRLVMFGGRTTQTAQGYSPITYEWDGQRWHRAATTGPENRDGHRMVYDPVRRRVVLFGGVNSAGAPMHFGDTWEWDGQVWTLVSNSGPDPRARHMMAYDIQRQRIVLFGGMFATFEGQVIYFDDTWEWNGSSWTQVDDGGGPTPRRNAAMAYDAARGQTILFAGLDDVDYQGDTWAWNGIEWTLLTVDGPPCRAFHTLDYDPNRQRVVLFGGAAPCVNWPFISDQQDTWEWDGETWTEVADGGPFKRRLGAMTYDTLRERIVLFGGWPASYQDNDVGPVLQDLPIGDLWEWDGTKWEERMSSIPRPRYGHRMAYDSARGVAVLHGGRVSIYGYENETWEWDGSRWAKLVLGGTYSPHNPQERGFHSLAFDSLRQVTWMFGGARNNGGFPFDETWKWDGQQWTIVDTPAEPSARYMQAMAYDAGRDRVVLFGGLSSNGVALSDTWEFDGSNWSQHPGAGPAARFEHAMAYDAERERVVLFGGAQALDINVPRFGDTWEWNGTTWTLVFESGPAPRQGAAVAYDSRRGRTIIRGGLAVSNGQFELLDDTWAWDGANWTQFASEGPGRRYVETMVYEPDRDRLFLFGGTNGVIATGDFLGEMWSYYLGVRGDGNSDGDVDLLDFAIYLDCVTGPGGGVAQTCEPFDFDDDGDIDFADYRALANHLTK